MIHISKFYFSCNMLLTLYSLCAINRKLLSFQVDDLERIKEMGIKPSKVGFYSSNQLHLQNMYAVAAISLVQSFVLKNRIFDSIFSYSL